MSTVKSLLLVSLLAFPACGDGGDREAREGHVESIDVPVETASLTTVPLMFEAVGTVQSKTSAVLAAQMMGQVTTVHVNEGDRVGRGQLLLEIDAREARAQLGEAQAGSEEVEGALEEIGQAITGAEAGRDAAQANADLASSTFERFQALLQKQSVSPQEFDEVEARNRAAQSELKRAESMLASVRQKKSQILARKAQVEAGLERAEVALSYSSIEAPVSGLVVKRHVDPGDMASPGLPLLTIEDDRSYQLEAAVKESLLPRMEIGQVVAVHFEALSLRGEGEVSEIVPLLDPSSRSTIVKVDLDPNRLLRSGTFGRVSFPIGEREVLSIPESALVRNGQLLGVYVLGPDRVARFRLVKTGKQYQGRIEILAGLSESDQIVTGQHPRLRSGVRVES